MSSDSDQEAKRLKLKQDYQDTFSSEAGQRVLEDLKQRFWYYKPMAIDISLREDLFFRDGSRWVVLSILNDMRPEPAEEDRQTHTHQE